MTISNARVFRVRWHPATDTKPSRITIRDLARKAITHTTQAYGEGEDTQTVVRYLQNIGFEVESSFEYKNDLFLIVKKK